MMGGIQQMVYDKVRDLADEILEGEFGEIDDFDVLAFKDALRDIEAEF